MKKGGDMKSMTKLRYERVLASLLTFCGMVLLFFAFFTPPRGEISASVLVAFGEVMTFVGALLGIDYHYRIKQ